MEIKILEERTNPLLKRHELRFEVAHATAATPTRDTVRTELAKAVHAPKDRVIIERMHPRFGTAVTRGEANIYDSAEAAKTISRDHILIRNGLKEKEAKAAGAPAAEPAKPVAPKAEATPAPPEPPAEAPTPATHPPKHAAGEATGHAKAPAGEAAPAEDAPKKAKPHAKKE